MRLALHANPGCAGNRAVRHPVTPGRKPDWFRQKLPTGPGYERIRRMLRQQSLHTVCQEAKCPNQWACFSEQTATFLILGDICTRGCRFCAIPGGQPAPPDPEEPARLAAAARDMGLTYAVITSVTRDDLADGGSAAFAACITALTSQLPDIKVEVLVPDFCGDASALETVLQSGPVVLNHNIETVAPRYPVVRPGAEYTRSLELLEKSRELAPDIVTKSGMMLGLGETRQQIKETLSDLRSAGVRFLTLGQYLQPSASHLPVASYITPETFDSWAAKALDMGFSQVAAGPLVRSSYKAREMYQQQSGL